MTEIPQSTIEAVGRAKMAYNHLAESFSFEKLKDFIAWEETDDRVRGEYSKQAAIAIQAALDEGGVVLTSGHAKTKTALMDLTIDHEALREAARAVVNDSNKHHAINKDHLDRLRALLPSEER